MEDGYSFLNPILKEYYSLKLFELSFKRHTHPHQRQTLPPFLKLNVFRENTGTLAFKSLKAMYYETRNERPGGITGKRKKRE